MKDRQIETGNHLESTVKKEETSWQNVRMDQLERLKRSNRQAKGCLAKELQTMGLSTETVQRILHL